jgi:16S rRNA processing protein RimM
LSGLATDGTRSILQVEQHWFHKGGVVLKFAGVESISEAERLGGWELQVPLEGRTKLEPGAGYVSEIVGCEVWVTGGPGERQLLGTVADVQFGAGEAPLLLVRSASPASQTVVRNGRKEQEFLIPYAEEFVGCTNLAERRIEMQLPQGLLELEAPLSSEEKQRQKSAAEAARVSGATRKRGK